MFHINYNLSRDYKIKQEYTPVISGDDLRYNHFCGDVKFIGGEGRFTADCSWITILDFALCMLPIRKAMSVRGEGDYSFDIDAAGSYERILFRYKEGNVSIIPSFSNVVVTAPWKEFDKELKGFVKNLVMDILNRNEGLGINRDFCYLMNFVSQL